MFPSATISSIAFLKSRKKLIFRRLVVAGRRNLIFHRRLTGPMEDGPLKPDARASLPPPLLRSWPLAPQRPIASTRRRSTPPLHRPSDALPRCCYSSPRPSAPLSATRHPRRTFLAVCPSLLVHPSACHRPTIQPSLFLTPPSPPLLPSLAVRPSLPVAVAYQS
jgi:hypothetical protein